MAFRPWKSSRDNGQTGGNAGGRKTAPQHPNAFQNEANPNMGATGQAPRQPMNRAVNQQVSRQIGPRTGQMPALNPQVPRQSQMPQPGQAQRQNMRGPGAPMQPQHPITAATQVIPRMSRQNPANPNRPHPNQGARPAGQFGPNNAGLAQQAPNTGTVPSLPSKRGARPQNSQHPQMTQSQQLGQTQVMRPIRPAQNPAQNQQPQFEPTVKVSKTPRVTQRRPAPVAQNSPMPSTPNPLDAALMQPSPVPAPSASNLAPRLNTSPVPAKPQAPNSAGLASQAPNNNAGLAQQAPRAGSISAISNDTNFNLPPVSDFSASPKPAPAPVPKPKGPHPLDVIKNDYSRTPVVNSVRPSLSVESIAAELGLKLGSNSMFSGDTLLSPNNSATSSEALPLPPLPAIPAANIQQLANPLVSPQVKLPEVGADGLPILTADRAKLGFESIVSSDVQELAKLKDEASLIEEVTKTRTLNYSRQQAACVRVGVVVYPGTLDDRDAARAIRLAGARPVPLWHGDQTLRNVDAIVIPGGFSYGDYLRCGAISALAPVMEKVKDAAKGGMPILGICNGFQILTECHLLPGALSKNDHQKFICKEQTLSVVNNGTAWTNAFDSSEIITIPMNNGEGRFVADRKTVDKLEAEGRVVFRYQNGNPNGSVADIAGICNEKGNVVGLMPHPEHAVEAGFGVDNGSGAGFSDGIDGLKFFQSLIAGILKGDFGTELPTDPNAVSVENG